VRSRAILFTVCIVVCSGCSSETTPPKDVSNGTESLPSPAAAPASQSTAAKPLVITAAEIETIESTIKKTMPKDYRNFLLEHSGTVATLEKQSLARGEYGVFPWSQAKEIVRENKGELEFLTRGEREPSFGNEVFLIGTNGGGDYYFVYLDETKHGIWYFDHEELSVKQSYKTFDEYLAALRKSSAE
jgi:hypothetical protein